MLFVEAHPTLTCDFSERSGLEAWLFLSYIELFDKEAYDDIGVSEERLGTKVTARR